MKKLFLILFIIGGLQMSYAQMTTEGKGTDCATQLMNDLNSCLTSNSITYDVTTGENGIVYITAQGSPPPGQIQSCIAQYNQPRTDCPEAPVVENNTPNNGNQIGKPPH